jgi:hypothetical protein
MWYRGRLLEMHLRYGCYEGGGGAKVIKGKPLDFTKHDHERISALVNRKPATERRVKQFCERMDRAGL